MVSLGLHGLGIGAGATRPVIDAVSAAAERAGFATLWIGEHVVMVDEGSSRYPYDVEGRIAVPADADWLDPLIALSFAAAATNRIGLATGVLLLPEHNPVITAKRAASLDSLSGGRRFALGVGVGWSREEFEALGVPFARRAERTEEYVAAMRTLWRDDVATFAGEFVSFERVRVNPRPARRTIPVICGGNSDEALRRVAEWSDGWYGFNLADVEEVAERVSFLRSACRRLGRDFRDLRVSVSLRESTPADVAKLADIGVDELVLVASPPYDPIAAEAWVDDLARQFMGASR